MLLIARDGSSNQRLITMVHCRTGNIVTDFEGISYPSWDRTAPAFLRWKYRVRRVLEVLGEFLSVYDGMVLSKYASFRKKDTLSFNATELLCVRGSNISSDILFARDRVLGILQCARGSTAAAVLLRQRYMNSRDFTYLHTFLPNCLLTYLVTYLIAYLPTCLPTCCLLA